MGKMTALIAALAALTAGPALADSGRLLITGSTTLIPIVSNAANQFTDTYGTWDKAASGLPAETITIETSGGGSGQGVRSVLDDVADIGMVSREIKDSETERLGTHETILVGVDAVAIAAHKDNPIHTKRSNLSTEELAAIFSGKYRRYSDYDQSLPDEEIVLLVRDASAGSAVMIQEQILNDVPVSQHALQMSSQGQLVRTLESNPYAFAYISLGLVNANDNLKAFAIGGVEPSDANVIGGSYTLSRPMLLVTRKADDPRVAAFTGYLLGEAGQAIVMDQGYIAASAGN